MRWLMVLAGCAGLLGAQELGVAVPPAPRGGVLDDARLFATVPEQREAIAGRLREFRERTGFTVEVALVDLLIGRSVFAESQQLRDAWLDEGPGLVLVLEVDSGRWEIGWSERTIRAGGSEMPAVGPSEVEPQERVLIMNRLRSLPEPGVRSIEDAVGLVDALMRELEATVGSVEPPVPHRGRLLLLALGLGSGLLLLALLIAAAVRRADRRAMDQLYFPSIEVGERLKAPRGGGKVSSRTFGASS